MWAGHNEGARPHPLEPVVNEETDMVDGFGEKPRPHHVVPLLADVGHTWGHVGGDVGGCGLCLVGGGVDGLEEGLGGGGGGQLRATSHPATSTHHETTARLGLGQG